MTTATMIVVGRGETAATNEDVSTARAGLNALLSSVSALTGATAAILHRASAAPLACEATYPADMPDQLDALQQTIALRSRSGARAVAAGRRDIVAMPIHSHSCGDLWLALRFDDEEAGKRVASLEAGLSAMVASHVDALHATEAAQLREATLAAALDQAECGIIALRADHSVLFTNAAADAILADRDGMELRRDVPRPTDYHSAVRFQEALDCVMAPSLHRGRPGARAMLLMLERERHRRPLIAVLSPARSGECNGGEAVIVYVTRPECSVGRGLEPICQLHGLSPVETHLVGHLMAGLTVAEAAGAMRVKPDTARAYLKQVFVKTDTHRQSELLQLMLRYQRAVRGEFTFSAA